MARVLARTVWVPREGSPLKERHLAGTTPPPDVAERITNPRAWKEEPAPESASAPEPVEPAGSPEVPPRHGPGSGREPWAKFAALNGWFPGDASRDEIIEGLTERGILDG